MLPSILMEDRSILQDKTWNKGYGKTSWVLYHVLIMWYKMDLKLYTLGVK